MDAVFDKRVAKSQGGVMRVFVAASLSLVATACSAHKKQDGLALRDQVQLYCHGLSSDLDSAAKAYAKVAPLLDGNQLAPDQRRRIVQSLQFDSIGATFDVRGEKMMAIETRMVFCLSVHKVDGADGIDTRIVVLDQKLREQDVDGVFAQGASGASSPQATATVDVVRRDSIAKHVEAAQLLDQLAALAKQIDAAPLKD